MKIMIKSQCDYVVITNIHAKSRKIHAKLTIKSRVISFKSRVIDTRAYTNLTPKFVLFTPINENNVSLTKITFH